MQQFWLHFTDVLVALALFTALGWAVLALTQWIKRKSFKKIDRELRWALLPCALLAATYVVFEKIIVLSLRPNGSGEPSFPSTHTMLTATIFFLTILILPKYLKNRTARIILDLLMLAAIILVAVGRVLANMHWPTDVIAGILFAALFAAIYFTVLRFTTPKAPQTSKSPQSPQNSPEPPKSTPDQILPKN